MSGGLLVATVVDDDALVGVMHAFAVDVGFAAPCHPLNKHDGNETADDQREQCVGDDADDFFEHSVVLSAEVGCGDDAEVCFGALAERCPNFICLHRLGFFCQFDGDPCAAWIVTDGDFEFGEGAGFFLHDGFLFVWHA